MPMSPAFVLAFYVVPACVVHTHGTAAHTIAHHLSNLTNMRVIAIYDKYAQRPDDRSSVRYALRPEMLSEDYGVQLSARTAGLGLV